MTDRIKEQILEIANSGEANMLDTEMVHLIAEREGYNEFHGRRAESSSSVFAIGPKVKTSSR